MERLIEKDFRLGFDDSSRLPSYVSIYEKLKNYEDLEEQGKLLKLPLAVGDITYTLNMLPSGKKSSCRDNGRCFLLCTVHFRRQVWKDCFHNARRGRVSVERIGEG